MLRVSTQIEDSEVDLRGIVDGTKVETGVAAGQELTRFAEAALGEDEDVIRDAREAVREKLGAAAMIDAAGVIGNFQRMVRIADGTGIPLDTPIAVLTSSIREDLGLNSYGSAGLTPELSFFKKTLAKVLQPLLPFVIKIVTKGFKAEPGN